MKMVIFVASIYFLLLLVDSKVILCKDKSNLTTSICKLSKEYRNNFAPQPHPCVVTPIVDLRNILKVLPESKTITVDIHIILYWNDYEIILSKGIEDTE